MNSKNSSPEAQKNSNGLTDTQKYALAGGTIIIALVLGFALFSGDSQEDTAKIFSEYLYNSPKSGIIMDIRDSPSSEVSSAVMQCGVNLISGGFFAKTQKDLLVYACDETGCISSKDLKEATEAQKNKTAGTSDISVEDEGELEFENSTNDVQDEMILEIEENESIVKNLNGSSEKGEEIAQETQEEFDESSLIVGFDEALADMSGRAYFYIKYAPQAKKVFHPNYVEVFMNESSDPSQCAVGVSNE